VSALEKRALQILRRAIGKDDAAFHEHQWEAIRLLVEDQARLLVVQRTGWGKSAVYFIATRLLREKGHGPTIIISPLLALMRNQIEGARSYGINLGTINSSQFKEENKETEAQLLAGNLDAVIISPERLANAGFMDDVLRPVANRVSMLVIDEVHCISDWGHDFRPDYKRIMSVLGFLPKNIPVLGTTATANKRVMDDVAGQLGENPTVLRGHLTRESLRLQSISFPNRSQRLAWLAETLSKLEGTGIIYVATTRDAELVTDWLKSRDISAEAYYGSLRGLSSGENRMERLRREEALLSNRVKALVATSALGMGYDKPDLAFVIHFQSPGSVVSYYQQVGRAGRGIPLAYGILLSGGEDDDIQKFFIRSAFPKEGLVTEILDLLDSSDNGLMLRELERKVNARPTKIKAAITFLAAESPAPILKEGSRYKRTLTQYVLPEEAIRRVLAVKESEWEAMQGYADHKECRMQFLASELDDRETLPCGQCENCAPEKVLPTEYDLETGLAAAEFMRNVIVEIPPKKLSGQSGEDSGLRFPQYGFPYRFGKLEHQPGRALCYWGDAGWGEVVLQSKRAGKLDPRLIQVSVESIRERWGPDPFPEWLTFVPSLHNPELVSDFAKELASALGIPCVDLVRKVRNNKPQKSMENTFHRCLNLDGCFEVSANVLPSPVLLFDDAVDSGWTFAVIAALLHEKGAGPVYPFAMASTATGG
jgi:ATP-dependent DNA helicase RecQ